MYVGVGLLNTLFSRMPCNHSSLNKRASMPAPESSMGLTRRLQRFKIAGILCGPHRGAHTRPCASFIHCLADRMPALYLQTVPFAVHSSEVSNSFNAPESSIHHGRTHSCLISVCFVLMCLFWFCSLLLASSSFKVPVAGVRVDRVLLREPHCNPIDGLACAQSTIITESNSNSQRSDRYKKHYRQQQHISCWSQDVTKTILSCLVQCLK